MIRPLSRDELKERFDSATPFRFMMIDDFLEPEVAREVAAAVPTFEEARALGREFSAVNEKKKVQITDSAKFAPPIARLNRALASPEFRADLEYITGIPHLLADPKLRGGGIHVTGPQGRLDVHVDFNYREEDAIHRRLNILVYLNPEWDPSWGGAVELWDQDVKRCHVRVPPVLNQCVLFETSETSYHGVEPVGENAPRPRQSFAAYYYTKDAPPGWDGKTHSTVFRARPDEKLRKFVVVPAEKAWVEGRRAVRKLRASLRGRG